MSWRSKAYEELPALSVRGPALRRSLRFVTAGWSFGVVWMVCCTVGSHIQIFCREVGFGDFAFGVMSSLPFVATFGQLFASLIIERTGLRKYQFLHCATAHRAAWLAVAAIPLLFGHGQLAVWLMLAVLAGSWLANSIAAPAWFTWMGDLIPRRIRGRYFAFRERLTLMVQIVVAVTLGILLDQLTLRDAAGRDLPQQPLIMTAAIAIFAVGAVCGMIDITLFRRIREVVPPRSAPPEPMIRWDEPAPAGAWAAVGHQARYFASAVYQLLLEPLKDRVFRHFVLFGATMTFSAIVGSSYFWLMCQEHMRFSKLATNMLFQVIGPVASILAAPLWGRMIDRWGRRPVLIVATVMGVGSLLPWLLVTPQLHGPQWLADGLNSVASAVGGVFGWHGTAIDQSAPLGAYLLAAVGCIIGGTSWTGIGIAQFGIVLGFSDGHGRSKFVAASSVLISFGGIAGGLCGGWIADALAAYKWDASPWRVGIFEWTNYHATMLAAVFARATAALWLVGMPEPGAKSVRDVVRYMRINVQNAVTTYLFYPMRVFGYGRERGSSASQGPAAPPPAEPISRQQRRDD